MKQILVKFLVITILISLTGCLGDDLDIESNRRILVKGKVLDNLGNPLSSISIVTSANDDDLGQTISDDSGNFSLISLDEQFDPLDIFINVDNFHQFNINYDYTGRSYFSEAHNNRLLYDLGTIILKEKAILNFTFNNILGDENTLVYEIKYTPVNNCELTLGELNPTDDCNFSASFEGVFDSLSEDQTLYIESVLSTNVILEYSLNSEQIQTIEIPLSNLETNYIFEY